MRIASVVAALLISFISLAQKSVNKGKIVLGDKTLEGYILTSSYDETPQEFLFCENKTGAFAPVQTSEIKAIQYDNKVTFEPYTITYYPMVKAIIDRTSLEYEHPVTGRRFLQKLVSGKVSLYVFNDNLGYATFFYNTSTDPVLKVLTDHSYVQDDGKFFTDRRYKDEILQLSKQLGCSNIATRDIEELIYGKFSFVKIFLKMNTCVGSTAENLNGKGGGLHIELEAKVAAYSITDYYLYDAYGSGNDKYASDQFWRPAYGFHVALEPANNRRSIQILIEALYNDFKSSFYYHRNKDSSFYSTKRLLISPAVRLYAGSKKVHPFIEAAVTIPVNLGSEFRSYLYGSPTQMNTDSRNHLGILGSVGATYSRFSLQARIGKDLNATDHTIFYGAVFGVTVL